MTRSWLNLEERVCVITGAAGGIGRAIAHALSEVGAIPVLIDLQLDAAKEAAAGLPGQSLAIGCDISVEDEVYAAREKVMQAFGRCDVLVNNAAVLRPKALIDSRLADWQAGLAINLGGYYLCSRIFGEEMLAREAGAIVHVGSIASHFPQPNALDYSASKAAILALSQQIAVEWGARGIRSNVVNPGMIQTPMTSKLNADPAVVAKRASMTASGRIGRPEDIANIVAFLASDRSAYVNGAELMATGGLHSMLMSLIPQPGLKKS